MRPEACSPDDSAVEMNQIVLPGHANALGTAFGGQVVSWIDICAAMVAQRHARRAVVTASMDQLDFIAPIKVGQLVNLKGMVNFVGRTSLEVGVRVEAEDPISGDRVHAVSAYLTFVALDTNGKPTSVPSLELDSPGARLRFEEGKARRTQRLALAEERSRIREAHAEAEDS